MLTVFRLRNFLFTFLYYIIRKLIRGILYHAYGGEAATIIIECYCSKPMSTHGITLVVYQIVHATLTANYETAYSRTRENIV